MKTRPGFKQSFIEYKRRFLYESRELSDLVKAPLIHSTQTARMLGVIFSSAHSEVLPTQFKLLAENITETSKHMKTLYRCALHKVQWKNFVRSPFAGEGCGRAEEAQNRT